MINKKFILSAFLIFAAISLLILFFDGNSSVGRIYCNAGGIRCVEMKKGWKSSPIMMSEKSIVLHKTDHSSSEEVMTVDFFDENSPLLGILNESIKGERNFSWGTVATIDSENKKLKSLNYSSLFNEKLYLRKQRAIISCSNINCLEEIIKVENNK